MTKLKINVSSFYYKDNDSILVKDEVTGINATYSLKYYDVVLDGVPWNPIKEVL